MTAVWAHALQTHEHVAESPVPRPAYVCRPTTWTHERSPSSECPLRNTLGLMYIFPLAILVVGEQVTTKIAGVGPQTGRDLLCAHSSRKARIGSINDARRAGA